MKKYISLYVLSLLAFSCTCFGGGSDTVPTNALENNALSTTLTQEIPECSICMLPLTEIKPINKIPAFFVPMPCCKNKQSICIDCCTKVAECPFCRKNLETNPQHIFRTMVRILSDYGLSCLTYGGDNYYMLAKISYDCAEAIKANKLPITPLGRVLSQHEQHVAHMMLPCKDIMRYYAGRLSGASNPFSYKLSKDERFILRTVAKKDADEHTASSSQQLSQ